MRDGLLKKIGPAKLAVMLPLAGLIAMWLLVLAAQLSDLYVQYGSAYNDYIKQQNQFHPSAYLFLLGIALFGAAAVFARRMAKHLQESPMSRAARGFTLISVFVALIISAIYGIGQFMSNFMGRGETTVNGQQARLDELMRVFNVYLPILLDAGVLVALIILAFVNKVEDTDD